MGQQHKEWADVTTLDTFPKVLKYNAEKWPDQIAMREKEFGIWREFSWLEYNDRVKWLSLAMIDLGITEGDVVGLLGDNRPEWVWGELAAHAIKGYSLGVYQDSMHEEVAYLINYAKAKIIIAEDEEQCDKLLELGDEIPSVEFIVYCDPRGMRKYDDPRLIDVEKLYETGRRLDKQNPQQYDALVSATKGEDLSILCTTSGTTSKPKLAQLRSGPFLEHCGAYLRADPREPGGNYVSVLPLPWIMEQVYVVGQALVARQIVNFVEEQETMMSDLREIGPSFVLLAPRVWENIVADVSARMMDSTPFKQKMYKLGMQLANKALDQGKRSKLAEWILLRALRDRLGFSNLTSAATGGAAMGPDTFRYLQAIGVPLKQLYGQTEMCGAYTVHHADDVDYDSVGVAFDNSEVKVTNPDSNGVGEIIAKSTGMFTGYLNNMQAYEEDVRDGWMHTGDAGYFKESGHLVVIDRLKDMSETSLGARYSPQFIENKLKFSPFIAEAVVVGKDRPWLSAIICIRYAIVAKWAEQKGIAFTNYTNLSAQPEVYQAVREEVLKVNESLPDAQKISKFILLYKELDADDGELTRTRKVRRGVVAEKYGDIIETLYSDDMQVDVDTVITYQDGTKTRIKTSLVVETLIEHEQPEAQSEQRRIA